MEYTGERCIPGKKGLELLELEHRSRYMLAARAAKGKRVLDLGCGAGYGTALLAETAEFVVGVDVSEEAIDYARNAFARKNIQFLPADVCADDFLERVQAVAAEPFDCVTCFELIEHVDVPMKLLRNVQQQLRTSGCFIVSTPNIDNPFEVDHVNPHHRMEYSLEEFRQCLETHFERVQIAGQRIHLLSSIGYAAEMDVSFSEWRPQSDHPPRYFVAVCANEQAETPSVRGLTITNDAHLRLLQSRLSETKLDQAHKGQRIAALERHLNDALASKPKGDPVRTEMERDELKRLVEKQHAELRAAHEERKRLEIELVEARHKEALLEQQRKEEGERSRQERVQHEEQTRQLRQKLEAEVERRFAEFDGPLRHMTEGLAALRASHERLMQDNEALRARLQTQLDRVQEQTQSTKSACDALQEQAASVRGSVTAAREELAALGIHVTAQEDRVAALDRRLQEEVQRIGRELHAFRHHPAVRRLLRVGKPGLKLLGAFGAGHQRRLAADLGTHLASRPLLPGASADESAHEMAILSDEAVGKLRKKLCNRSQDVTVSIVLPTYNRAETLGAAIRSVLAQSYTKWELLVVDDGSTDRTAETVDPYVRESGGRIRTIRIEHQGVSAARDTGVQNATGQLIAYLDSDNEWLPDYLLFMTHALLDAGRACGYCAMRVIDHDDGGAETFRKRRFDYEALIKNNYIDINIFMHRRTLFEKLGGFDRQLRRWVDWDLILRYVRHHPPVEVPIVLCDYHRRKKLQQITLEEPSAYKLKVLSKHLVSWKLLEEERGRRARDLVSVVIPVHGLLKLTRRCVESIHAHRAAMNIEVILVDNGSDGETHTGLKALARRFRFVRVIRNYENYLFALGNNLGVAASKGEYVVLLNNDTVVSAGWLEPLIDTLRQDPQIGAVGPKLLYEDGTVQAAGMVFSDRSRIPYHIYRNEPGDAPHVNKGRSFQAMTGACLAMRAEDFIALRGFDARYVNGCEDIDLCFRLRLLLGKRIVYDPRSVVVHLEGKSAGRSHAILYNRELFVRFWGNKVVPDDTAFYAEDGFGVASYEKPGNEPDGECAAYVPRLTGREGTPSPQRGATHNVGLVSIWHTRGVSFVTQQIARALESPECRTHIFARWESERFDNCGAVCHPRVMNGGDDPSPETMMAWVKGNKIDLVLFMEVHPNDWKRVAALKQAGVRVMCYEHLDVLRREHLNSYRVFDYVLCPAFYNATVFRSEFPGIRRLTVPWGIEGARTRSAAGDSREGPLRFVHISGWGGVNHRKNTDLVIRAFDDAGDMHAELYLHTQAPLASYPADVRHVLDRNRRIRVFEGTIPDILSAYRERDMLLFPSKREGLGLPIVEALAMGLPVLTTDGYLMKQWLHPDVHGVLCRRDARGGSDSIQEKAPRYLPQVRVDASHLTMLMRNLAEDAHRVEEMKAHVARDRPVWQWTWQPKMLREQFGRILGDPDYAPPDDMAYIPAFVREFEQARVARETGEENG